MSADTSAPDTPVVSVAEAIARMEAIEAALPASDGLACFNRVYLDVSRKVLIRLIKVSTRTPRSWPSWT